MWMNLIRSEWIRRGLSGPEHKYWRRYHKNLPHFHLNIWTIRAHLKPTQILHDVDLGSWMKFCPSNLSAVIYLFLISQNMSEIWSKALVQGTKIRAKPEQMWIRKNKMTGSVTQKPRMPPGGWEA